MRRRQRIVRTGVFARVVEVAPIRERGARGGSEKGEGAAEQEKFHAASKQMALLVSTHAPLKKNDCALGRFAGNFASVRGYGLRAYESRQGRNAATVV